MTDYQRIIRASTETVVSEKELRATTKKNEHDRNQQLLSIMHDAVCVAVGVAAICIIAMGVVWVIHLITPWTWLTDTQLDSVRNALFSGAIGGFVSNRLQKI